MITGISSAKSEYLNDTSEFIKLLNEVSLSNDGIINKRAKAALQY